MDLTQRVLDAFAARVKALGLPNVVFLLLADGETMPTRRLPAPVLTGPMLVEFVVYRDGDWSAREVPVWSPTGIALFSSPREQ